MSTPATKGAWDCHAHVFGPYEHYPLAANRTYTPPEALVQQYLGLLDQMGITHGVLVHPSAYGNDYRLLFETLQNNDRLRGVIVANAENTLNFTALHDRGIRAARFSHRSGAGTNFVGSASMDDFESLKSTLANANLHAEVWTDCVALQDIDKILMSSPVPIVIDHMGGFNPQNGINDQGFQKLLRLLDTGHVWIKLCVYRNLLNEADYDIGKPFMEAMIKQNPDRLVWGSDWPHLRVLPTPNTPDLLDLLKQWAPDDLAVEKILTTNPSVLYN